MRAKLSNTMFTTNIGPFDGDGWESLMQICFRLKYESEHYQQTPASPGDYGIEGFTETGKVFQCYCPDYDMKSNELYEKQRDKITKDLKKIERNGNDLKRFLGDRKIKEWIFVTPEYRMNELVAHCKQKCDELRQLGLDILDNDFKIVIHDLNNFSREIPIALDTSDKKLFIKADHHNANAITQWKDEQISLSDNALRKHTKRFTSGGINVDDKANSLTESTIRDFLNGESILRKWQQLHPEAYDKFLILFSELEKDVSQKCMFPTNDNNKMYDELKQMVSDKIQNSFFKYLDAITISQLTDRCMAYWLLRCPLDFD